MNRLAVFVAAAAVGFACGPGPTPSETETSLSTAQIADGTTAPARAVLPTLRQAQGERFLGITFQQPPQVVRVEIVAPDALLFTAGQVQLQALARFNDGSTQDVTASAQWTSTDPSIATIAAGGLLTAVAPGNVIIKVQADQHSDSTPVTVRPQLQGVQVSASRTTLPLNYDTVLTATATYVDGTTEDVTRFATWRSLDPNVVQLAPNAPQMNGLGVQVGMASVDAYLRGLHGSVAIQVIAGP